MRRARSGSRLRPMATTRPDRIAAGMAGRCMRPMVERRSGVLAPADDAGRRHRAPRRRPAPAGPTAARRPGRSRAGSAGHSSATMPPRSTRWASPRAPPGDRHDQSERLARQPRDRSRVRALEDRPVEPGWSLDLRVAQPECPAPRCPLRGIRDPRTERRARRVLALVDAGQQAFARLDQRPSASRVRARRETEHRRTRLEPCVEPGIAASEWRLVGHDAHRWSTRRCRGGQELDDTRVVVHADDLDEDALHPRRRQHGDPVGEGRLARPIGHGERRPDRPARGDRDARRVQRGLEGRHVARGAAGPRRRRPGCPPGRGCHAPRTRMPAAAARWRAPALPRHRGAVRRPGRVRHGGASPALRSRPASTASRASRTAPSVHARARRDSPTASSARRCVSHAGATTISAPAATCAEISPRATCG